MSTIEAIERRQEYEQMKRKKDAERKAKEETKRRLAELAEERRLKTEYANKALLGTLEQSATTTTATATSTSTQVKTPPSTTTTCGDCILQIRMVGGATIKHTFKATDTMQVVYDYVQSVRTDTATSSVPFSLTAFPKKEYKSGNLDITLTAAGLAPRGQIVMNLSGGEQKQATSSGGGDVSTMYFQSLLHQVSATSVTSGRTIDLSTKPIIVIAFATRHDGGYVEKQFNRIKKMYPGIYFGICDMDEKCELATKQGVTSSGVFHIYKGMERVEEVTRDIHALESALRAHAPMTTPTEPSSTYDRITSAAIILSRHTPTSFKVQLEGSPAKGMFWDVISMDPHIARVGTWTYIPKNASLEDDADGIDGLFSFTFLYHPTPTPSTSTTSTSTSPRSIVFHYTKPWRHDAPPLDQHTLTFTYATDHEDEDEDEDEYDHQHEDDEDEEM